MWGPIHDQSLAVIADRGLSHTPHFREKPQPEFQLPALCSWPSESVLKKELLVLYFNQLTETWAVQSELLNFIFICIFPDQSGSSIINNQNAVILTNQDRTIRINQTVQICICIHVDQSGSREGIYNNWPHICLSGVRFWFPPEAVSLRFQFFTWMKFLLLPHPILGTTVGIRCGQWPFVDKPQ